MGRMKQVAQKNAKGMPPRKALAGKRKSLSDTPPPAPAADTPKVPKKRRWRPGTVALREIRQHQQSTAMLIPRLPFARLVRETANEVGNSNGGIRWKQSALATLQEASEDYLTELFACTEDSSVYRGRKTINVEDMTHTRWMRFRDESCKPPDLVLQLPRSRAVTTDAAEIYAAVAADDGDDDDDDDDEDHEASDE